MGMAFVSCDSTDPFSLREQLFEFFSGETGHERLLAVDGGVDRGAFFFLQAQDFFFDRVAGNQLVGGDDAGLPDAMGAVGGLRLDRWIPPRIEMNDGVGGGKIQADAASFQTDQEDGNRGIALEAIHDFLTLLGRAIEIAEWNLKLLQAFTDEVQHRDELAEDEDAVVAVDRFLEELVEEVQLGGGLFLIDADETQITTDLAQTEQTSEHLHPLRTGAHILAGCSGTLLDVAQ